MVNTPKYDSSALPYCCPQSPSHIAYTHWVTFQMQSIVHCILCSYKHLSIHNSHIFSVFLSPLLFPTNWFVCSATKCSAICRTCYSSSLSRYMYSANADSKFVRLVQGGRGGMVGFCWLRMTQTACVQLKEDERAFAQHAIACWGASPRNRFQLVGNTRGNDA